MKHARIKGSRFRKLRTWALRLFKPSESYYPPCTVRKVLADFSLRMTDDAIAKLYVTYRLVKKREMVKNV